MNYNVLVKPGYAEDSTNGWLWLNFISKKALDDSQIIEDLKTTIRTCARHVVESKRIGVSNKHKKCPPQDEGNFCSNCGACLPDTDEIEEMIEDESVAIVRDLYSYNCVDIDQDFVDILEQRGWQLWGSPVNGRIVFITGLDRAIAGYPTMPEVESKKVTFK